MAEKKTLTFWPSLRLPFCFNLNNPLRFLRDSYTERLNTMTATCTPTQQQTHTLHNIAIKQAP